MLLDTMTMKIPLLLSLLSLNFRVEPIVRVRMAQMLAFLLLLLPVLMGRGVSTRSR